MVSRMPTCTHINIPRASSALSLSLCRHTSNTFIPSLQFKSTAASTQHSQLLQKATNLSKIVAVGETLTTQCHGDRDPVVQLHPCDWVHSLNPQPAVKESVVSGVLLYK